MQNINLSTVILSPVPIDELVVRLADEMERRADLRSKPSNEIASPEQKRLYGDKAASEHIGCTPQVIGKLRKADKIRYYTLGTRYYYYAHELDQDLQGGKNRFGELRGNRKKVKG